MTTAAIIVRQKLASVAVIHCGGDNYGVTAVAVSGARYHLQHAFNSKAAAEAMAAKIRAKGSLDERFWDLVGYVTASPADAYLAAKGRAEASRAEAAAEARWAA